MAYYLFPAARQDTLSPAAVIRQRLAEGFWGVPERSHHVRALKSGDRACFYASGDGVVAHAIIGDTADRPIPAERRTLGWLDQGRLMLPMSSATFLPSRVVLSPAVRAGLDAFQGKDPFAVWSWFVQNTRRLTAHDFEMLTRSR